MTTTTNTKAVNTVALTSKNGRHRVLFVLESGASHGLISEDGQPARRADVQVMADEIKSYRDLGWTAQASRLG